MAADPARRFGRRSLTFGGVLALALGALTGALLFAHSDSASAATINQCNNVFNADAQTVQCSVTVVNNLTNSPATTGSIITVNGGTPVSSSNLVTFVSQCNGSGNAGGSTVECSVNIINNIAVNGPSPATAATVNQCNGGDPFPSPSVGPAGLCNPYPATTTSATITQCNGSGNGGGLVTSATDPSGCTASGTVSSTLPVTVNQCNGSANGGGGELNCSTTMTTNVVDTGPGTTTTTGPGGTTTTTGPGGTTTTTGPGGTTTTTGPGGTTTTTGPGPGGTTTTTGPGGGGTTTTLGSGGTTGGSGGTTGGSGGNTAASGSGGSTAATGSGATTGGGASAVTATPRTTG
jgi:hypothetical protein